MSQQEINATKVIIKTDNGEIVINNPDVKRSFYEWQRFLSNFWR